MKRPANCRNASNDGIGEDCGDCDGDDNDGDISRSMKYCSELK